jgi:hypothetical protein
VRVRLIITKASFCIDSSGGLAQQLSLLNRLNQCPNPPVGWVLGALGSWRNRAAGLEKSGHFQLLDLLFRWFNVSTASKRNCHAKQVLMRPLASEEAIEISTLPCQNSEALFGCIEAASRKTFSFNLTGNAAVQHRFLPTTCSLHLQKLASSVHSGLTEAVRHVWRYSPVELESQDRVTCHCLPASRARDSTFQWFLKAAVAVNAPFSSLAEDSNPNMPLLMPLSPPSENH